MKKIKGQAWDLGLLYKSPSDPKIESDMKSLEKKCENFSNRFDTDEKRYLKNEDELVKALSEYEKLVAELDCKPLIYFYYLKDIEGENKTALSMLPLLSNRLSKASNKIIFFYLSLGTIKKEIQERFLSSPKLVAYRVYLNRIFDDAKYLLSSPEEKIINLKSLPAREMWVDGNQRLLGQLTIKWKNKVLPLPEAQSLINTLHKTKERYALQALITEKYKLIASFSEAEINAVYTDKKIEDELRGYATPYEDTVRGYRNDPQVVKNLVETVTKSFHVSERFYKVKAKLLKLKKLKYADRAVNVGKIKTKISFEDSYKSLKNIFGNIDKKYSSILESYVENGQIDALPKVGKQGGAYCSSTYSHPTFVLLNHTNNLGSFTTFAHEMGHAFHSELSRSQGPFYSRYSISLAETASTLFESIALDAIFHTLSDKEKVIALHNKINDSVSTIFRQIACFNFELDLHNEMRKKGFLSKDEIAELHNKNMKAYLGQSFQLSPDDGYFFVQWGHIRRFFYVYTYAYGMLVSSVLLKRYREDKRFWKSIEEFLSSGSNDSPENILKKIGIDVSSPQFFQEGIDVIEEDISKLEKILKL